MGIRFPVKTFLPAPSRLRLIVCMAASLLLGACNLNFDLNSVQLTNGASDTGADVDANISLDTGPGDTSPADAADTSLGDTSPSDTGTPDADADATNVDADATPDVSVRSCAGNLGAIRGTCDPNRPSDCSATQSCSLRAVLINNQIDRFETTCANNSDFGTAQQGDSCTSVSDCAPGLFCVNWPSPDPRGRVCAKPCALQSGAGCDEATEYCTNPFSDKLSGIGFCTARCDPYTADACSVGQTCTPDYNYPDETCLPNFRCLSNLQTPTKAAGDTCSRANHETDGCAGGLICAPLSGGDTCVQPCHDVSDCAPNAECVDLDGWNFKYCTP